MKKCLNLAKWLKQIFIQKTFTLNLKATLFAYDFDLKSSLLLKLRAFTGFITKNLEENDLPSLRLNKGHSTKLKFQNANE